MTQYYWPANLTKSPAGWVTSLVDWPNIATVEATPQESVASAVETLSLQISDRIRDDATIPIPSELKPGQIQIPADALTSAKLDAYVKKQNEKHLRNAFQIEQANRERRSIYLSEFRINLEPVERLRGQADDAAVKFASIALNSSYILNGGALVALPAILQFTENGTIDPGRIATSVWFFVAGIAFAAITNFLAFHSVMQAGEGHNYEIAARAIDVRIAHYPPDDIQIHQADSALSRDSSKKKLGSATTISRFGVTSYILSILSFLFGVCIIVRSLSATA
ncbi:MAG TPA: hypothetical protein VIL84_01995 [Devosiaceae bacterium]